MVLYNIGIWLYGGLVKLAALFNGKAKLWSEGRRKIFSRMAEAIDPNQPIVWIHSASLGEFEQGRPVIEAIKKEHPKYKILLTFFSPSGYEIRKNYAGADYIFYLPNDTPGNAKRFIDIVNPEIAIFIKYEFWLNYLKQLRKIECRTFIISAIFRKDSIFFKPYGGLFRKALTTFERIFVQNTESQQLLASIGVTDVTVSGDTRFDRVAEIAAAAKQLNIVERFSKGNKILIAGSTWPPDEELLIKLMSDYPDIKFIIAPHEIEESRICKLISEIHVPVLRYTKCIPESNLAEAKVLVIDTIGILSSVYQYGDYGYIGGGFGEGIHNTLEAAAFGLPLAFGPNYNKFKEARDLIEIGAAKRIADYEELNNWLKDLASDPSEYATAKAKALSYVSHNTGATAKITGYIFG